jgi:molybdate transport system substrate-binding protein
MRHLILIAFLLLPSLARAQALTVFAAASLTDAMNDISAAWATQGHQKLTLSFAASSILARQLDQGADVNVFASADEEWMDWAAKRNLIAEDTRRSLLTNHLVLVVPQAHPLRVDIKPGFDLAALLGPDGRLATGDPAHVPVGRYAQQALTALGLWQVAEPRLARADNVRSALLLVERGEAAPPAKVMIAGTFPASSHAPITYPFAVVRKGDTPAARALLAFCESAAGRTIFARHGFGAE